MDKFKYENQYWVGAWWKMTLESAECHFIDDLCGNLDCYLNDEKINKSDDGSFYQSTLTMENGMKLEVEIYFDDEKEEWICVAEEI